MGGYFFGRTFGFICCLRLSLFGYCYISTRLSLCCFGCFASLAAFLLLLLFVAVWATALHLLLFGLLCHALLRNLHTFIFQYISYMYM